MRAVAVDPPVIHLGIVCVQLRFCSYSRGTGRLQRHRVLADDKVAKIWCEASVSRRLN
jgi:hypothetical protein